MTTVRRSRDQIATSGIDRMKVDATADEEIARHIAEHSDAATDTVDRLADARVVSYPPAAMNGRAVRARNPMASRSHRRCLAARAFPVGAPVEEACGLRG